MSGFQVLGIANNGDEAIKMFKNFSKKPDIIILDYRMPIKNGLDALKEILQIDHDSRVCDALGRITRYASMICLTLTIQPKCLMSYHSNLTCRRERKNETARQTQRIKERF